MPSLLLNTSLAVRCSFLSSHLKVFKDLSKMSERLFSLLLQVLRRTGRSLSNDDGDINENGRKSIGLEWQNNNFPRESLFFVNFFAIVARLRRETS